MVAGLSGDYFVIRLGLLDWGSIIIDPIDKLVLELNTQLNTWNKTKFSEFAQQKCDWEWNDLELL